MAESVIQKSLTSDVSKLNNRNDYQSNRLKINSGTIGIGTADAANRWTIGGVNSSTDKRAWIYSGNKSSVSSTQNGIYIGTDGIEVRIAQSGISNNYTRIDGGGIQATLVQIYDEGGANHANIVLDEDTSEGTAGGRRVGIPNGIITSYSGASASSPNLFYNKCYFKGGTEPAISSDRRIKKDITHIDTKKAIEFIRGLKPSQFHLTTGVDDYFHHGFIAQEVKPIAWDGLVEGDGEDMYSICYGEIIADIVAVLQELLAEREG